VVDPPAGLDRVARGIVAETIRYAYLSFAAVLDRAIADSRAFAPEIRLGGATLLAVLQAPAKALAGRRADARERRLVERIYDELQATGTVERNLPEEERRVRDRYATEVLATRGPSPGAAEVFPFRPRERVVTRVDRAREARRQDALLASAEVIPLRPAGPLMQASASVPVAAAAAFASSVTRQPMLFVVPKASPESSDRAPVPAAAKRARTPVPVRQAHEAVAVEAASPPPEAPVRPSDDGGAGDAPVQLTLDHDVGDGPVGTKTVKRMRALGIETVRDLLKADPAALALQLASRGVTQQTVGEWQDQALLMCAVPGLRGTHAQLLVGAGYRSAEAIADAEAEKLCADVLAFAVTPAGQRVLRNADVPDIESIKGWREDARSMQAA
jgi:hypothetical protein